MHKMTSVKAGAFDSNRAKSSVAAALQLVLNDSHALYQLTHHYHFNVEGRHFYGLHHLFDEQYNELFSDDDCIWGCFCYADLEICIRIKNDGKEVSEEIIRNTFYHELFHTFNYLWNTDTDEALAQSFANFMREFETTSNYGS